jgi:5-formyltetrahydrofolate cyclo-ligase
MPPSTSSAKHALRRELRAARRNLSPLEQHRAAHRLAARLRNFGPFRRAKHLALYWAADGEISLAPVIRLAWRLGKQLYFPRLTTRGGLAFARLGPRDRTGKNRFGLREPTLAAPSCPVTALDLVLLPLVGFDRLGGRLGMGGGFYDRSFQQCRHRPKPLRVGVAHSCQEVAPLVLESWDVPLHLILTDRAQIRCNRPRRPGQAV